MNVPPASSNLRQVEKPAWVRQRLVLCLDGTWNKRDSGTNVLHHFGLALEGDQPENDDGEIFRQTRYYHEGVGTGLLDGITGGGFGFGLEENVRDAYNWLVANYHGSEDPKTADEIYLFGFSRGAYTARSLVGFIASCGLLRRGAPISVEQLWDNYCTLGRQFEKRRSFWDLPFGKAPVDIRRITALVRDPWKIHAMEIHRAKERAAGRAVREDAPDSVPGQVARHLTPAEQLLVRWSRRVRITYLGIYDTVGALGIDALAIPGVRSQLAMHHNTRATTIIQNCRHALAVDEHRSSFNHTPFQQYVGHGTGGNSDDVEENEDGEVPSQDSLAKARTYWHRQSAMWRRKMTQRWFVGAHSNIGGGYPDNLLAQISLHWLLEGAREAGLALEALQYLAPSPLPTPRDSYEEFAKPFWTHIIRGKRCYRLIDPAPEPRATPQADEAAKQPTAGFSLQSIHEEVDVSVLANFAQPRPGRADEPPYRPPNVIEYAARRVNDPRANLSPDEAKRLAAIAAEKAPHRWLKTLPASLIFVLWASLAAYGLAAAFRFFGADFQVSLSGMHLWGVALALALIDWGESWGNHSLALAPLLPQRRALCDTLYWLRTFGFVFFVFGFCAAIPHLWQLGWHAPDIAGAWRDACGVVRRWWQVPLAATFGLWLASSFDRAWTKGWGKSWLPGGAVGALLAPVLVCSLILLAWLASVVLTPLFGHGSPLPGKTTLSASAHLAGLLLLLEFAGACFLNSLTWVAEPMARANLGTIRALQKYRTVEGITGQFDAWHHLLACRWDETDQDQHLPGHDRSDKPTGAAARALIKTLRETLWRDIFGYIPLYFCVLMFGLWFAAQYLVGWHWLNWNRIGLPVWLLLPLVAMLADYLEDTFHLMFVRRYERGKQPPSFVPLVSFVTSMLKLAAVCAASMLVTGALAVGSWQVASQGEFSGWRGTVSLLIAVLAASVIVIVGISAPVYRWHTRRKPLQPTSADALMEYN